MQSQGVAISWCDSVDGGVKGQPALAAEVIPTETESREVWWAWWKRSSRILTWKRCVFKCDEDFHPDKRWRLWTQTQVKLLLFSFVLEDRSSLLKLVGWRGTFQSTGWFLKPKNCDEAFEGLKYKVPQVWMCTCGKLLELIKTCGSQNTLYLHEKMCIWLRLA